jgi:hypothetical protein
MAGVSVFDIPTAEDDPEAWNTIFIAGQKCPGTCLPLDGERKRYVEHKKSKGSSKDILVDQGLEPTEVSIRIRTTNVTQYRDLYNFYLKFMDPDRVLSRLSVVTVSHPQLYSRGIKMGYFYSAPLPKPTAEAGIRPYIHEFRFKIVGPKTQINGSGTSTKPKAVTGNPPSSQQGRNGVSNAVASLNSGATIVSGISLGSLFSPSSDLGPTFTPPPAVPSPLLTPQAVQQLSDAGDTTATFINDLVGNAAPLP